MAVQAQQNGFMSTVVAFAIGAIGAVTIGLAIGLAMLAWKAIVWVAKLLFRITRPEVSTNTDVATVSVMSPVVIQEGQAPNIHPVFANDLNIIPAELRRVDLKNGFVSIRYYAQEGRAKAKLTISSKSLQKRCGYVTVYLEDRLVSSINQAESEYRLEAEEELGEFPPIAKAKPQPVVKVEAEPEAVIEIQPELPVAKAAESTTVKPRVERKAKAPQKREVSYRGTLLEAGMAEKTSSKSGEGEKKFPWYRVLIHDDKLGGENALWGNDLERAIKESGAQPGEQIELGVVGDTEVMHRGKPKTKTIWAVSKI